ncbi:serine hydrolase-domain-containing protein [Aspergillus parasiticus]|uniref:Serine hydrolase-domain-containing protein n=1 Tax=Aspergillus parasiticus TaxID=5067 RepID=A0A5N6E562_ASPPA|nr:serine hydrolase-domain-containing protein [Aspergillus parasiticus]
MRFLCFHGRGTNSQVSTLRSHDIKHRINCLGQQIMESQIAALRHELDNIHTYDYVEGTVPAPLAPGKSITIVLERTLVDIGRPLELEAFFPTNGDYYDYFSFESADSVQKALDDLASFLETEGPYDGLIAFSLGGALASTYLIREARRHPEKPLPFKCAIFLSGGAPLDPVALERGEVSLLDDTVAGNQVLRGLPTVHIWGSNDKLWGDRSERLYALCDPHERTMVLHEDGHAVPGVRAKEALLRSVRAIRRTVGRVAMASW